MGGREIIASITHISPIGGGRVCCLLDTPQATDVAEGEEAGEQFLAGKGFEFLEGGGFGEIELAAAGAAEGSHVGVAAEGFAEIVTVGADIESFAADDAEFDVRQVDAFDLVVEDGDEAFFAFDFDALARQFVEGDAVLFDGADHGGELIEVAAELAEGGLDLLRGEGGDFGGGDGFAPGVLGGGGGAKTADAFVFLFLGHEEVLDLGGAADHEDEEAGGVGIEGAAVADFFHV